MNATINELKNITYWMFPKRIVFIFGKNSSHEARENANNEGQRWWAFVLPFILLFNDCF